MEKLRKITVQVPKMSLDKAQAYTGGNVTLTVRAALEQLVCDLAQQETAKPRRELNERD